MNEAETLKKKGFDAYDRKDYAEAFKCWSKAAELGNAAAQNNTAVCQSANTVTEEGK
jgi:TPR repeat protein